MVAAGEYLFFSCPAVCGAARPRASIPIRITSPALFVEGPGPGRDWWEKALSEKPFSARERENSQQNMIAQCNAQFPPLDPGGGSFPRGEGFPPIVITEPDDPTLKARGACYMTAAIYYEAVIVLGGHYFENGQKAACLSCCCRL